MRPSIRKAGVAGLIVMAGLPLSLHGATVHYVSPTGLHLHPFTNWPTAATNIQAAVDAAAGGDTVLVTNGAYALCSEIVIGTNLTVQSVNGPTTTVVDGCQTTRCFRVLDGAGCTISGFTIANGETYSAESVGGGVWLGASNALVACVFGACTARCGGAVYADLSTVSNCTFVGNAAGLSGGGLHSADATVEDCTFERNTAFAGGAVCCSTSTDLQATLTNMAWMLLGITNALGQLDAAANTITNIMLPVLPSSLASFPQTGTGITRTRTQVSTDLAPPTIGILHCTLVSNTAAYGGGIFTCDSPATVASNCVLVANQAQMGGGLFAIRSGLVCDSTLAGNMADSLGGGAVMLDAGPLHSCSIASNRAEIAGGGALLGSLGMSVATNAVPMASAFASGFTCVQDSEFTANSAGAMGGGLLLIGSSAADRVAVARNQSTWGGGIANWGGQVRDCTLTNNTASFGGGGFGLQGDFCRCTFEGNQAIWMGGGVLVLPVYNGVSIRDSFVANNVAFSGAGMGLVTGATVTACIILGNCASHTGGGVLCLGGGDLISSLVSQNSALAGGGVYSLGGRILNATIVGNIASNTGGGLCTITNAFFGGGYSSPSPPLLPTTVLNTIVYGNTASNGANCADQGTNVIYSCCCTVPAPSRGGSDNITNNPGLTPAGRLQSGSPCINAGTNGAIVAGETDLDGNPRIIGGVVDMGAYESTNGATANGIPWGWLLQYGLATDGSADRLDPDGDTMNDLQEYLADTDPTNANSVLRFIGIGQERGGTLLEWKGGSDAWQFLECKDDPTDSANPWTAILALPPPTSVTHAVIDMRSANRSLFYRLRAER